MNFNGSLIQSNPRKCQSNKEKGENCPILNLLNKPSYESSKQNSNPIAAIKNAINVQTNELISRLIDILFRSFKMKEISQEILIQYLF